MGTHTENALEKYQAAKGETEGSGEWFEVTQEQVNAFADLTHDHQFIHVDPEAAKATPFGGTIAHGFLTLSMLTHLCATIPQDTSRFEGILMGVNYGFDKVRFISPVKVGARMRATAVLSDAVAKNANNLLVTRTITVEVEGEDKPACIAEWLTLLTYG